MAAATDTVQTSPNAPFPSCVATFDTVELLEDIILHLPLRELLRSQQVCKTWRACIEGSFKLQQALYYKPYNNDRCVWNNKYWAKRGAEKETPPKSIAHYQPHGFTSLKTDAAIRPLLNPMLRHLAFTVWRPGRFISLFHDGIIAPQLNNCNNEAEDSIAYVREHGEPSVMDEAQLNSMHKKDAAWKQMLVMQPPPKLLWVWCDPLGRFGFNVRNEDGVNMGDLVEACRKHWFDCLQCPMDSAIAKWDFGGYYLAELDVPGINEAGKMTGADFLLRLKAQKDWTTEDDDTVSESDSDWD